VVTSANTFLADANCARYVGADVLFADVDPITGNITPETLQPVLEADLRKRVKAIIQVHFAGPADGPAADSSHGRSARRFSGR